MNAMRMVLGVGLLATPWMAGAGEASCDHPDTAPPAAEDHASVILRGEHLPDSSGVPVGQVVLAPQNYEGKSVLVEGTVRKACTRKGCWMELAADSGSPGVRVTFKDYAFFVPIDSAGAKARVQGVVRLAELSAEQAAHYEAEGAKVPRGADGKPREVQLVATGVELRR